MATERVPEQTMIPLVEPQIGGNEWKYLRECIETNWLSSAGPFVDRFERMVAEYIGVKHAVATTNGTAALHISMILAGVATDDEVIVPTLTFIAPANAVRYAGGWPVFVDADPLYWQMDSNRVADFLDKGCRWHEGRLINRSTGRRIKAIVPVHLLGHACEMDSIMSVARKYGIPVIEDATESLGATYKGKQTGSIGDIGCLSFNGNKTVTAGGGGMIVTNDAALAERARYLTTQAKNEPVESIHNEVGYNYRLSNLHAAVGCAQMEQLPSFITKKKEIARAYRQLLGPIENVETMQEAPWASSTFWLYTIVQSGSNGTSRPLAAFLKDAGIQTRPLWQPLHQSPAHRGSQAIGGDVAGQLCKRALCLPSSVGLTGQEVEFVVNSIRSFFKTAL